MHCFDCYQAKDLVNKRHNLVRNILRELIKKARKGSTVDLEPNVVGHAERPDLMVHMGGRTNIFRCSNYKPILSISTSTTSF